jgi:hypothetical protein
MKRTEVNGSTLNGPLVMKLSSKKRDETNSIKFLLAQQLREYLSENHGTKEVVRWIKKVLKKLS